MVFFMSYSHMLAPQKGIITVKMFDIISLKDAHFLLWIYCHLARL